MAGGREGLIAAAPFCAAMVLAGLLLPPVRRRPTLQAALLGLAVAAGYGAYFLRPDGAAAWEGDAASFYRMAEEWPWRPGGWWRYRLLVPTLVHLLPGSVNLGYFAVSLACVAVAAPVLSLLLADLGYGSAARLAGVVLYLASFAPLYNAYNYAMPDPAAMLVLLLAARALARGRDREFAAWLVVGVLTKEVVLFLAPAHWLWRRGPVLRTVLVAAPAALLFLGLRLLPAEAAAVGGLAQMDSWLFPWRHQPDNVRRLYSPFAAGWALAVVGCLRPTRWVVAGAPFALLVGACLLITDAGRMLVYLVPFAIPAMLEGCGRWEPPAWPSLACVALAVLSMRLHENFVLFTPVPGEWRTGLALALALPVAILAWRARARAAPAP